MIEIKEHIKSERLGVTTDHAQSQRKHWPADNRPTQISLSLYVTGKLLVVEVITFHVFTRNFPEISDLYCVAYIHTHAQASGKQSTRNHLQM